MKFLFSCAQSYNFSKIYQNSLRYSNTAAFNNVFYGSYYFGKSSIPLTNLTVGQALDRAADEHGDDTLYISHQQRISKSYSEVRKEAEKLASGLIACGLRKGDRVAIYSPNCYEWPLAQFAAAKAGLITVSINFASQPLEVENCLRKTGCKSVISFDKLKYVDFYSVFNKIIPNLETSNPMKLQVEKLPNLETVIMISEEEKGGIIRFKDAMNMGNKESAEILSEVEKLVESDDPMCLSFTSGTTGNPKAATLSHHGQLNGANHMALRLGYDAMLSVTNCCLLPLFHIFGSIMGVFMPLMHKTTIVLPNFTFDASESLKSIEKYKCNKVVGTPTMLIDLVKTHKILRTDISSLHQAILGGSSVPEGVLKDLRHEMRIPYIQRGYGLTETCAAAAVQNLNTDHDAVMTGFMEPVDGYEVKLVNSNGQLVPRNTKGEICIRGYQLFSGYWEDPEKTAEVVDEKGWFHTGDVGEMNDKGWIRHDSRLKDIVIRGGENIYVAEIENLLSNHPAVLEVYICGVPDERLGEELCCWISVKPGMTLTQEEVKSFCEGKLSYYKIPRYIMFVEEFPKTTVGKVKKFEMTNISREKLKL